MPTFGLILMQGCIKEYPADLKKSESAECMCMGSDEKNASMRSRAPMSVPRAARSSFESRVKRFLKR